MNRSRSVLVAVVAVTFLIAPTAGDVGGCGRTAEELDLARFSAVRRAIECERCGECGVSSTRCGRACDPSSPALDLGATCHPVEHDGDVCLRALQHTSCERFARAVADVGAEVPTECAFCRTGPPVEEEGGTFAPPGIVPLVDGGDGAAP